MQQLHHSDILSYALTRVANEFTQDKQATLLGLQRCIEDSNRRRGLGNKARYDLIDEAGPGYSIRSTARPAANSSADDVTVSETVKK
jgi:hypothetical protein